MTIDIPSMPPQLQERVVCSIIASIHYDVPANILLAIAEKENGKPGQWVENTNGTHDVGAMQFNTSYINTLTTKYGITAEHVANAGCYPYDLAAWRIHGHLIKDQGDIWTRAANYHSRTPYYNSIYKVDLIKRANKWAAWLDEIFAGNTKKMTDVVANAVTNLEKATKKKQESADLPSAKTYVPRSVFVKRRNDDGS